jgi:hypothetical protein
MELPFSIEQLNVAVCPARTVIRRTNLHIGLCASATVLIVSAADDEQSTIARSEPLTIVEALTVIR